MAEGGKRDVKLALDEDAADMLLELAGGPRKQGDFVSQLVRAAWEQRRPDNQPSGVQRELAEIRERLARLEMSLASPSLSPDN
jgi:hypothetical protein